MAETLVDFSGIRLFSEIPQANLEEIAHMTRMSRVKKHEPVYQAGQQALFVHFLMEGWIKVLRTNANGKELIFDILGPGEVFGEECVFGEASQALYDTSAEALEASLIGRIAKVDFVRALSRHEHLAIRFGRHLSERIQKMQRHLAGMVFYTVPGRLAHLLLACYGRCGGTGSLSGCVRLTHQEMAKLIGCSRETITTVIGQFLRANLVRCHSRVITGLDEKGLSRLLEALPNSAAAHPTSRRSVRLSIDKFPTNGSARAHRLSLAADPAWRHGRAAR